MSKKNYILYCLIAFFNLCCKGPQGPQGPQSPVGPQVIFAYPFANSEGPYEDFSTKQIQIKFNRIMDLASIKQAVKLTSDRQSLNIDTTNIQSSDGVLFIFYPIDSLGHRDFLWKIQERDVFTISTSAKDINDNYLASPYTMTFMPEPYFRVVDFYPFDGDTINASDTIRIHFNSPVTNLIFSEISLSPAVKGRWVIDNAYDDFTHYYFACDTSFRSNTQYTLTISTNASDKEGNQLPQQFVSTFTTSPFEILYLFPANGDMEVSLYRTISVFFSAPIDTSTVRNAVHITPDIPGIFIMPGVSSHFSIVPDFELLQNTNYQLTIDPTLGSIFGDHLANQCQYSFKTAEFKLVTSAPRHGSAGESIYLIIEAYFNAVLDTGTIRSAFGSYPEITGYVKLFPGTAYFHYYPDPPFRYNTTYTITIKRDIRSIGGVHPRYNQQFIFTTGS